MKVMKEGFTFNEAEFFEENYGKRGKKYFGDGGRGAGGGGLGRLVQKKRKRVSLQPNPPTPTVNKVCIYIVNCHIENNEKILIFLM